MDNILVAATKNQVRSLGAVLSATFALRSSRRTLGLFEELGGLIFIAGGMLLLRVMTGAPTHHGMPMAPFLLSGLITFWLFRTTVGQVSNLQSAKATFRNNPRITSLDVLVARAAVNVFIYTCIGAAAFATVYLAGLSPGLERPELVLALCLLMGIWAFGFGLCLGAIYLYAPPLKVVVGGLLHMAMWLSGIMFLWPEVPYMGRWFFAANPLFHYMELLRDAYFEAYQTALGDWQFLLTVVFVTLALGLMLERVVRAKAQEQTQRPQEETDPFTENMV